ncbi:MAG: tRNA (adenosine(37)-N6)-threonylcarbamoyltransferase complex ATPase subunit type 1 TsaE [Corallococcus sp.]|nr:tRNA (adenosine(37)-N6)-threonylcarbamoyltransferase complex ATPase subunit type 1 TsaE [Corallococcus sp.]
MENTTCEKFTTHSAEETVDLGRKFAARLKGGETVLLDGDLGAGKTHFTKGIAEGMGIDEVVTSPTFTLHNAYSGRCLTLNHFDFYRIEDSGEAEMLGLGELISVKDAVAVIEWWRNVTPLLPKKRTVIIFERVTDNVRTIQIKEEI